MTKEELHRVLDLQRKAGSLLIWLDQQVRDDPTLWNEENFETWSCTDSCEARIRYLSGVFPSDLHIDDSDVPACTQFVSSFFNPLSNSEIKPRKFVVIEDLAIENDVKLSRPEIEALTQIATLKHDRSLQRALMLCWHTHELRRRSHFVSQSIATHTLRQTQDTETRQRLNAETLKQAMDQVLDLHSLGEFLCMELRRTQMQAWLSPDENYQNLCVDILWQARETLLEAMKNITK